MAREDYEANEKDIDRVNEITGLELEAGRRDGQETEDGFVPSHPLDDPQTLCRALVETIANEGPEEYAYFANENRQRIADAAQRDESVIEVLLIGYKMGITLGNAACMNDLGALYYMGELVPQDYAKAAELYHMAMQAGCYQSIINLGYIYEYGRIGRPDHQKAFQYYALAAALAPSCEATYKLGDMYSRGVAVERDMCVANALWEKAFELANNREDLAQPAARIAKLLMDPDCAQWDIKPDPLRALSLYQTAEVGLRLSIANGATYYKKRLQEVIEGQGWARELVELMGA